MVVRSAEVVLHTTSRRYEQAALQDCSKNLNRCRRLVYTDLLAAVNFNHMTPKDKAIELVRRFNHIYKDQENSVLAAMLVIDLINSDDVDSKKKEYWKDVRIALERLF